jgi:hypothetical protein
MTLAAANFFLKYAKARGVSKVARGESSSKVTREGFMQAYARVKGDPKKLTTRMATPTQSWAERRDNFVGRHMAQMTLHGEKLWETSGKYKGQPTRRHLGLIMWAMTPDPNGVGRFIAKARGVKVPAARKNGLSKRRTSGAAYKGQGVRVPAEWIDAVKDAVEFLSRFLDEGGSSAAAQKAFVRLPLNAEGLSESLRELLKSASTHPPHGVEVVVHRGPIPDAPEATAIYHPRLDRVEFKPYATNRTIQHELTHMIQWRATAGLRVAKPGTQISARAAKGEAAGVGQARAGRVAVGTRRAFWTVETEIRGIALFGERGGKKGILIASRRPGLTRSVREVDTKFYPFPVDPMPAESIAVTQGQRVAKGDVLFTQPGSPKIHDRPTPVEFEAYLGPLVAAMEDAVDAVYQKIWANAEDVTDRERVDRANAEVRQFVKDVQGAISGDRRAQRDAAKRLADAGARRIARNEELEATRLETTADRLRRARLLARDPVLRAAWASDQPRANSRTTTAKRDDPDLWEEVKTEVTRGTKGGKAGQWSARKAQMAVALYQQRGGGYIGPKSPKNALAKWTREEWGTRSGKASLVTGERYLPRAAREALTPAEYAETTRAKRAGLRRGEQFTPQPGRIAKKTAKYRK